MSEQIKQLWEEAAKSTAAYPSGQNNSWETQVNFMEKFAELIVRECAEWVNDNVGLIDEEARADLLKHFGVEE